MITIIKVIEEGKQLNEAIILFREYGKELGADLGFQSFEDELKNPLYKYGESTGSLLLAYWNNELAGCVALQSLQTANACEMKRLFVRPAFRSNKIGDVLVNEIVKTAIHLGYENMKLDTLQRLQAAIHLYQKHGFIITTAYYENPLPEVVYMQKKLS